MCAEQDPNTDRHLVETLFVDLIEVRSMRCAQWQQVHVIRKLNNMYIEMYSTKCTRALKVE